MAIAEFKSSGLPLGAGVNSFMQGPTMNQPTRREILKWSAAVAGTSLLGGSAFADDTPKKKILFFTKSSGFQHDVVNRTRSQDARSQTACVRRKGADRSGAPPTGYEVTCSKDGSLFTPEKLSRFDALVFYTTGDLDHRRDRQAATDAGRRQAGADRLRRRR